MLVALWALSIVAAVVIVGTDPETWRAADRMIDDAQGAAADCAHLLRGGHDTAARVAADQHHDAAAWTRAWSGIHARLTERLVAMHLPSETTKDPS